MASVLTPEQEAQIQRDPHDECALSARHQKQSHNTDQFSLVSFSFSSNEWGQGCGLWSTGNSHNSAQHQK